MKIETLKIAYFAFTGLVIFSACNLGAPDASERLKHKSGVRIDANYLISTRHGETKYRHRDCGWEDLSLVAKPGTLAVEFSRAEIHVGDACYHNRRVGRITKISPSAFETTHRVAKGESGSGVFDVNGRLLGICKAFNTQTRRGIFVRSDAILKFIRECDGHGQ